MPARKPLAVIVDMIVNIQIFQCRITVDFDKTKDFYATLPRISENCQCEDCKYFEDILIKKDFYLFQILKSMGVDISRQPNINPDGICSVGPTDKYNKAYMGYYNIYGQLGKTQNKTQKRNAQGELESVDYITHTSDSNINYTVKQIKPGELTIEFYIETEKINAC